MASSAITIVKNTFKFSNLWGSIVPMQVIGIYALFQIISGAAPSWWWIATLIGYFLLAILGISVGYHRLFCHKGFKTNTFIRRFLLWCGITAGQGSPVFWVGIHRGYHHRYSDKDKDAHSPQHGLLHSYILWMFKRDSTSLWGLAPRSILDFFKDKDMEFAHRHYILIFWITHLSLALINFQLWLYLLGFASFVTLHSFLAQTSLTHIKKLGYKNYSTNDNSVNVPWLFPLILGECWHNNHHGEGRNPNYGRKWWELDPTFWLIKLIRTD